MNYASVGRRFLAMLLDALFLLLPLVAVNHVLPFFGSVVVGLFYFPFFESSAARATPGKYLMGLQVASVNGARIEFRTAVVRYFIKLLSSLLLFFGHFFAFFTAQKQALHDLVAETVVVYGRNELSLADVWWQEVKQVFGAQGAASTHSGVAGVAGVAGMAGGAGGSGSEKTPPPAYPDTLSELERLQTLRERGALTDAEFEEQKRKLLRS